MMTTTNTVELETWEEVRNWCDDYGRFKPSYVEQINSQMYPKDAFSLGQMASKIWLKNCLQVVPIQSNTQWALLGCWIGSLVPLLHDSFAIKRIYGFDLDPVSISMAEVFNRTYLENDWKFKGVVADVSMMTTNDMEFQTGGEVIQVKPDVVINTSCEHMGTEWFETADSDQLIVMQTNDSPDFAGHINICNNIEDMQSKYPMSKTHFVGSLKTPVYTRFMQIGWK